jgi:hypothetical protein
MPDFGVEAEMVAPPAQFPLTFTDEEGEVHVFDSADELGSYVEFVNDDDPPYECVDSSGRRCRLVIWGLDVVICQVIPDHFDAAVIKILERREDVSNGDFVGEYVEQADGIPLRSIVIHPNAAPAATPSKWDDSPIAPEGNASERASRLSREEFHRMWMLARTGDKFFKR